MNPTTNSLELDSRGLIATCSKCGQANRLAYERLGQPARCAKCATELPQPDEPVDVNDDAAFSAMVERSALPVLVDFWAPWCGPCKMIAPEVARAARAGAGSWIAAKLNTEEHPGLAQQYRVSAIPLLVLFKNGSEAARQAGLMPADAIRRFVASAL